MGMEVTLDTSGYKPDELKVEIKEGELCVEGKHEERSQTGEGMVSRQFSRRFGMPQNVKKEGIVSNLSQDGVMVITMPKEQRIEEVERGDTPIQIDHVRSSAERKTMTEEASAKLKREEGISNQGRVDKFEESMKQMESRMSNSLTLDSQGMNDSFFPKDWMMIPPSSLNENFGSMLDRKRDCSTIKHNEDENKVEVHLDTSGYKPDELKVQVESGIVRVEGKHEEKSEAGAVMVSRQFVKEYALPESSKPNGVESSLSKDGVLVITMPKPSKAINQDKSRSVPIAIK